MIQKSGVNWSGRQGLCLDKGGDCGRPCLFLLKIMEGGSIID